MTMRASGQGTRYATRLPLLLCMLSDVPGISPVVVFVLRALLVLTLPSKQRRIRHLSAVLVRNHDELVTAPLRPTSVRSVDFFDSPTSSHPPFSQGKEAVRVTSSKGKGRARSASTSSWKASFSRYEAGETPYEEKERELVLDPSFSSPSFHVPPTRTRARRSSSAGTLLTRLPQSSIEEEPNSPSSPSTPPILPAVTRPRSSSRLSASSIQSSSTIRQAPRLPSAAEQSRIAAAEERPPAPRGAATSLFAQREKQRREEALRRRLLDSFVSLEFIPAEEELAARASSPVLERRKRGASIVSVPPLRPNGNRMRRSDSASSVLSTASLGSPRKTMLRKRTASSPFLPTSSSFAFSSTPTSTAIPPQPFFVSPPSFSATNPSFFIDRNDFLLPAAYPPTAACDEAERCAFWGGLRDTRVRAKVFVREQRSESREGKGKERELDGDGDDWKCLVEWDVDLSGLTSIGRDVRRNVFLSFPFSNSPSTRS
jgi:hypothetical protein